MVWQQYVLLGLMVIALLAALYQTYTDRVGEYTFWKVVLVLIFQVGLAALIISIGHLGFAGYTLLSIYAANGVMAVSKIGELDEPLEPGGELGVYAVLWGLMVWAIFSLA